MAHSPLTQRKMIPIHCTAARWWDFNGVIAQWKEVWLHGCVLDRAVRILDSCLPFPDSHNVNHFLCLPSLLICSLEVTGLCVIMINSLI